MSWQCDRKGSEEDVIESEGGFKGWKLDKAMRYKTVQEEREENAIAIAKHLSKSIEEIIPRLLGRVEFYKTASTGAMVWKLKFKEDPR